MHSTPAQDPFLPRPSDPEEVQRSFVEYTLREALGAVIASDAHDGVLAAALHRYGRPYLPASASEVEAFVADPFHRAVEEMFGLKVADTAVREVRGILPSAFETATITIRADDPVAVDVDPLSYFDRETRPVPLTSAEPSETSKFSTVPAAPRQGRVLYILTELDEVYGSIVIDLEPQSPVIRARGVRELLASLEPEGIEPVIVVDARHTGTHPGLEQLGARLPRGARMLIWGERDAVRRALPMLVHRPEWVVCGPEAELTDLAAMLGLLLGK